MTQIRHDRRRGVWAKHEQSMPVKGSHVTTVPHRTGFTLVELLVVVAIIGVLAALITPAIFQARVSAQNAAIRAEIDLLHMGIMNYKNRFGSYPPCLSNCNFAGDMTARNHLGRLFPRCDKQSDRLANGNKRAGFPPKVDQFHVILDNNGIDDDEDGTPDNPEENFYNEITPLDSLLFWLGGYTNNPTNPIFGGTREKLYDEDASRVSPNSGAYHPSGKSNSPFLYIDATNYGTTFTFSDFALTKPMPGGPYSSVPRTPGGTDWHNPGKFQILNAGLDEQWGTDDDLSNFWKGTRGDQE